MFPLQDLNMNINLNKSLFILLFLNCDHIKSVLWLKVHEQITLSDSLHANTGFESFLNLNILIWYGETDRVQMAAS